jgi:hypothetical protein
LAVSAAVATLGNMMAEQIAPPSTLGPRCGVCHQSRAVEESYHRAEPVGQRPDGRFEYEERPGPPPPNQGRGNDENVMTIYFCEGKGDC